MKNNKNNRLESIDEYQKATLKYDTFPAFSKGDFGRSDDGIMLATEKGLIEKALGLTGEAGEAADKFKKIIRDKNGNISTQDREEIVKELGDVMWYLSTISAYLGVNLSEVANKNIEKLESRLQRNKIHGAGDNR